MSLGHNVTAMHSVWRHQLQHSEGRVEIYVLGLVMMWRIETRRGFLLNGKHTTLNTSHVMEENGKDVTKNGFDLFDALYNLHSRDAARIFAGRHTYFVCFSALCFLSPGTPIDRCRPRLCDQRNRGFHADKAFFFSEDKQRSARTFSRSRPHPSCVEIFGKRRSITTKLHVTDLVVRLSYSIPISRSIHLSPILFSCWIPLKKSMLAR